MQLFIVIIHSNQTYNFGNLCRLRGFIMSVGYNMDLHRSNSLIAPRSGFD